MGAAALVEDALGRAFDMARQATRDLTPEELLRPPKPHIAWLTWHMARVQDANFSGLLETEQLWIRKAWHARFNMPADPRDYGSGHRQTPAQVDAFAVSDKLLLYDYMDTVFDQTRSYLATVADQDLSRARAVKKQHHAIERDRHHRDLDRVTPVRPQQSCPQARPSSCMWASSRFAGTTTNRSSTFAIRRGPLPTA